MSTFLDIIMSAFIFGVLTLSLGRVQVNMNNTKAQNQFSYTVQTNAVELARLVEHDIVKIGYHVTGPKITAADSSSIAFNAALDNTGASTPIQYSVGAPSGLTETSNPRDFVLLRTVNGNTTSINFGLIQFNLKYFDAQNAIIPTPIIGSAQLDKIRGIRIRFSIQSSESVPVDTVWESVSWEKTILPRNLSNLNY
ncbi:MAG: hypothetical protein EHM64_09100 [Ignavibacteriae bacterium]|nr:MAG: hypothetical protein EHM64_09100 [Ignavibacteriota bacterium]